MLTEPIRVRLVWPCPKSSTQREADQERAATQNGREKADKGKQCRALVHAGRWPNLVVECGSDAGQVEPAKGDDFRVDLRQPSTHADSFLGEIPQALIERDDLRIRRSNL